MAITAPPSPRPNIWSELLRVTILIAAAVAVMSPFLTGDIVGGVDARWYAYMLADYIEQARLGHVLISVGQGPFAWNGGIHLFRSAPVYMMVGRLVDLLTFRQLNAFALQHLTVVTSAVAGTLGFYAASVRLIPSRRWIATGLALLYLTTPSWLSTVVTTEAYMTYMTFAALPVVLYGNARTVLRSDGRGYIILGAGFALLWMCHPPIAFNAMIATLVIQCGLVMERGVVSWRNLAAGAAAFAVLGAYYFVSMSEVPLPPHSRTTASCLIQLAGFALFWVGIGRFALFPRAYGWTACAVAGAGAVWLTDRPWACWVAATAVTWLACVLVFKAIGRGDFKKHAFALLFLCTLVGAAIAEGWVGQYGIFRTAIEFLSDNTAHLRDIFVPLADPVRTFQAFQPGWGLLVVFAAASLSIFGSRPAGAKFFFATIIGLAVCFLRVPLVSNFLVGRFPVDFAAMCGVPLPLRIAPIIAGFTAMAGVIWMATGGGASRNARLGMGVALAALVVWSGFQTLPLQRISRNADSGPANTEKNLRPENAILDAYVYLLVPIPSYFSHGKTDPLLESRLLDGEGNVRVGPMEDAFLMEKHGAQETTLLTAPLPATNVWFEVGPGITVQPHEHLLLRFEFDPKRDYSGYFLFQSEHSYREYHLPDSGEPSAFGAGNSRPSVISLWNSGSTPEHYTFSESTEPGNDVPHSGGFFAKLHVSKLDSSSLPVSLESLLPYRARVNAPAGGMLETFRVFIPGYHATVDGKEAPVVQSREHLVAVPVDSGIHEVELRFVGTAKLWMAAVLSGLGWVCILASCAFGALARRRPASC
jgi:hypothetical protein